MSTAPTAEEKQELDRVLRAKHRHFVLLVVLICIASLTFLFPSVSPLVVVFVGMGICGVGVSAMSIQYFQRCPRCSLRMTRGRTVCADCGLEFYAPEVSTTKKELEE